MVLPDPSKFVSRVRFSHAAPLKLKETTMTIESAATFLVCVILLSCGITVLVGLVLLVNNLLHRYWKELNWNLPESMQSVRYVEVDKTQEPSLDRK
jgi:hypothetical protein